MSVPPSPPYRLRWVVLAVLLTAEAMNLLDSTIVAVAAPAIHAGLPGPASDVQWFGAAYTLPFALLLVTGGRLGDIVGRRRVFRIGVAGFVLASAACALAGSAGMLIGARAVQGAAAALVIPQTIGLIRALFEGAELARALGTIGPVMGLSAICGPALGGLLTHADLFGSSWRAAFLVNVPLGLGVLACGSLLREDRAPVRPRLDPAGTALLVLGTGLLTFPLVDAGTAGWPLRSTLLLTAGIAVLVGFGRQQRRRCARGAGSLVEPGLFTRPGFPAALVASTLFFAVLNGLMLVVVLAVQAGGGDAGVLGAGLTLLPWSAGMAVASWTAGARLVPRFGSAVMGAGLAVLALGLLGAVAAWTAHPIGYPPLLPLGLGVAGLGLGLFTVPFFTAALHRVRPQETGSAAGLLNAVQQLGGTLGIAVLGSVYLGSVPAGAAAAAVRACWVAVGVVAATAVAARVLARSDDTGPAPDPSPLSGSSPAASG